MNLALETRRPCAVKAERTFQKTMNTSEEVLSINILFSGRMRNRAEAKAMLSMIDRGLGGFRSLPELDFRAGYLTGKIEEKKNAGFVTPGQAEQLKNLLYAKYEIIRQLAEEG